MYYYTTISIYIYMYMGVCEGLCVVYQNGMLSHIDVCHRSASCHTQSHRMASHPLYCISPNAKIKTL